MKNKGYAKFWRANKVHYGKQVVYGWETPRQKQRAHTQALCIPFGKCPSFWSSSRFCKQQEIMVLKPLWISFKKVDRLLPTLKSHLNVTHSPVKIFYFCSFKLNMNRSFFITGCKLYIENHAFDQRNSKIH